MEAPMVLNMSSNIATSVVNCNEDQLYANSYPASETGSDSTVHRRIESKMPVKENSYSDSQGATCRQIYPQITCIPQDSVIFCFILSVWDNIVGPQTVYVWKKKRKVFPHNVLMEKQTRRMSKSSGFEAYIPLAGTSARTSRSQSISSCADQSDFTSTTSKGDQVCDLQDCADSSASILSHANDSNVHPKGIDRHLGISDMGLYLPSVVRYVTEHSVGVGESNVFPSNKMTFHLLMAPSQNVIVLSVKFFVSENEVGVPYCMSAVIPSENESLVLPALNLCTDALMRISAQVRLLITKKRLQSENKVEDSLLEICDTLSSLRVAGLNQYPIENFSCKPDDRRMAERMLTSHLQTMGTTLVIADSPTEANKVVMWLAQFLNENELCTSRIALSDFQWPYQPGITLQAVIRDSSGEIDLSSSKLLCSRYPISLVDLTNNTVRQMAPINIHAKNSEVAFRQQLLALWHDLDHVPAPSQSLFEDVEVSSPLVKGFLQEWDRLASCEIDVRKNYLKSFLRSLHYYALAIIVWTRNEWTAERSKREQKSLLQTITSTFLLEDADLKVVLAQAEIIQPGFMSLVLE